MKGLFIENRRTESLGNSRKEVLIVCFSLSQLVVGLNLAVCKDLFYLILVDKIDQAFIAQYNIPENVCITADRNIIVARANSIKLVISTATLAAPAHAHIFNMYEDFKKRGVNVLEIQHGLFQWGINFQDNAKILSFESLRYGAGDVPSLATDQAVWFGDKGIGYPRRLNRAVLDKIVVPKFVLIATNLHWHIYSDQERLRFVAIVKKVVESFPEQLFVWHPHPAEEKRGMIDIGYAGLNGLRCKNLLLYGAKYDFFQPMISQFEELAYLSCRGLITAGTTIIDFELAGKPAAIFECSAVSDLNNSISGVPTFDSAASAGKFLSNLNQPPTKTGIFKEFLPADFEELTKKLLTTHS